MKARDCVAAGGLLLALASGAWAQDEEDAALAELMETLEQETAVATRTRMNRDFVPGMVSVLDGNEQIAGFGNIARTYADAEDNRNGLLRTGPIGSTPKLPGQFGLAWSPFGSTTFGLSWYQVGDRDASTLDSGQFDCEAGCLGPPRHVAICGQGGLRAAGRGDRLARCPKPSSAHAA